MIILFATDGSASSEAALQSLTTLPWPEGTRVHVLSVAATALIGVGAFPDGAAMIAENLAAIYDAERESAKEAVSQAAATLAQAGLTATTEIRDGDPPHQIITAAAEVGADLVVLGSHGRTGLDDLILGSVAQNVARHAECAVLVARAGKGAASVILATDGSDNARDATAFLGGLRLPEGAKVRVISVTRPYNPFPGILPTDPEAFEEAAERVRARHCEIAGRHASEAVEALRPTGKECEQEVRVGDPTEEIIAAAQEVNADLIVAGARGVSLIKGLLVGSVADRLLKQAPCSVLLVH